MAAAGGNGGGGATGRRVGGGGIGRGNVEEGATESPLANNKAACFGDLIR